MSDRHKRLLIAASIALLAMGAVVLVTLAGRDEPDDNAAPAAVGGGQPTPFRGGSLPPGVSGRAAPRIVLDDARGGRVDTRRLRGRPYVVTFLYVNCKDVCPLIGIELKQALQRLGPRGDDVTVLAVSVDPRGDTRAAVRRWLTKLRMPGNVRYLIGSGEQLRPSGAATTPRRSRAATPTARTAPASGWLTATAAGARSSPVACRCRPPTSRTTCACCSTNRRDEFAPTSIGVTVVKGGAAGAPPPDWIRGRSLVVGLRPVPRFGVLGRQHNASMATEPHNLRPDVVEIHIAIGRFITGFTEIEQAVRTGMSQFLCEARDKPWDPQQAAAWDVIPAAGSCPLLAERAEGER